MSWTELRYYESSETLRELCARAIGYTPSKMKCEQIIACFHMARDYYEAAESSSRTMAPLLLFYGIEHLAKALTLIFGGKRYSDLAAIGESHGLTMAAPQQGMGSLDGYACKLQESGTFVSFLETFSYDIKFHYWQNGELRLKVSSPLELRGLAVTLKNALMGISSLRTLSAKTFGQLPGVAEVWILLDRDMQDPTYADRKYFIQIHNRSIEDLHIESEESSDWDRVYEEDNDTYVVSKRIPPAFATMSQIEVTHNSFLEATIYLQDVNLFLSDWISEYIGIYILGMIVRYYPDIWVSIVSRKRDSKILAIIEQFIDRSKSSFPRAALQLLNNPYVIKNRFVLPIARLPRGLDLEDNQAIP